MNKGNILAALKHVEDEVYTLLSAEGCGPFDGGCVAIATALHNVIGGDICVLVRPDGTADHAVVLKAGLLWDYRGPQTTRLAIEVFNQEELSNTPWKCIGYRSITASDLPEAITDAAVIAGLTSILKSCLQDCI